MNLGSTLTVAFLRSRNRKLADVSEPHTKFHSDAQVSIDDPLRLTFSAEALKLLPIQSNRTHEQVPGQQHLGS